MNNETLAPDIAWEPSGHLSEVALSALADGEEELLDAAMHDHLGSCDACAVQLGEMAMRSARVGEALAPLGAGARASAPAPVIAVPAAPVIMPLRNGGPAARERRKVPMGAIAAALVVAALGAAPSLIAAPAKLEQSFTVMRKVLPSLVRLLPQALARAWSGPGGSAAVVVWSLAVVLVIAGFAIAKRASKKMLVNGGRR
jgi:hypothetical protein